MLSTSLERNRGKSGMRIITAIVLGLFLMPPAAAEELKTFKDWFVGCDNLRSCVALGVPQADGETGAYVKIARSGEATAEPSVDFVLYADTPVPDQKFALAFDDLMLTGLPAAPLSPAIEENFMRASLTGPEARAFAAALNKANSLTIALVGPDGSVVKDASPGIVSLAGASAALLYMDDIQQRIGTPTALRKPGTIDVSVIPPLPAPPTIAAVPLKAMPAPLPPVPAAVTKLNADGECSEGIDPIAVALSPSQTLWGVCWSAGAYNIFYHFFLAEGDKAKPMVFELPSVIGETGNELINPGLAEGGTTISSFYLGRGIGDCGSRGEWAWDGSKFRLIRYSAMDDCRGIPSNDWPALYRAGAD
jgi:hypothetical protein